MADGSVFAGELRGLCVGSPPWHHDPLRLHRPRLYRLGPLLAVVPRSGVSCAAVQRRLERAERRLRRSQRRVRAEARVGLSSVHIFPRDWAEVSPDGSYVAVHIGSQRSCPVRPTTRGNVHGFSRASRSRLLKRMAQVDRQASSRALFVTLTYPASFQVDFSTCKSHLKAFAQRLMRKFVRGSLIWRLELTKQSVPHYHLIVFGQRFIPHEWVATAWYEIVGTGNEQHRAAGTEVRRVHDAREAFTYAAKYAAKLPSSDSVETEGRVWGIYGRDHLPARVIQLRLDRGPATRLARAIRGLASSRSRGAPIPRWPPRWLILDGRRGVGVIRWANGGELPAAPFSSELRAFLDSHGYKTHR